MYGASETVRGGGGVRNSDFHIAVANIYRSHTTAAFRLFQTQIPGSEATFDGPEVPGRDFIGPEVAGRDVATLFDS